ncbi:MAG: hypothetical protein PQJ61_01190 [Spirochaetales bacterium]|uniref:Uncharacterized protein n=1 Tax=Candidatus Thalassospirochaeta sargassi TaxID=3119039 RepID=A0AAJ1I9X6_9SPIO|nr:hypothetical protein [Spirochaetales bacterium]
MKTRLPDNESSLVFIMKDKRSYLVKGEVHFEYGGGNYQFMKTWISYKHPGHGAAVVYIDEVYQGEQQVF